MCPGPWSIIVESVCVPILIKLYQQLLRWNINSVICQLHTVQSLSIWLIIVALTYNRLAAIAFHLLISSYASKLTNQPTNRHPHTGCWMVGPVPPSGWSIHAPAWFEFFSLTNHRPHIELDMDRRTREWSDSMTSSVEWWRKPPSRTSRKPKAPAATVSMAWDDILTMSRWCWCPWDSIWELGKDWRETDHTVDSINVTYMDWIGV